MNKTDVVRALAALAHEHRLGIFRLLVKRGPSGLPAGEIADKVGIGPTNTSFHLKELESRRLAPRNPGRPLHPIRHRCGRGCASSSRTSRRNAARPTGAFGAGLCDRYQGVPSEEDNCEMSERSFNVLFLCTGNSARSIMAEAVLNSLGRGQFKAYSAGSQPKGTVHPLALKVLSSATLPIDGLTSKSWEVFAQPGAPVMHFVFTVCDNAAGETCPVWPGHLATALLGHRGPRCRRRLRIGEGKGIRDRHALFAQSHRCLHEFSHPIAGCYIALDTELRRIGQMPGRSHRTSEPS